MIVNEYGDRPSIANRGYCILWVTLSLIPYVNIVLMGTFFIIYIGERFVGDIELKDNKFNNFWFKN